MGRPKKNNSRKRKKSEQVEVEPEYLGTIEPGDDLMETENQEITQATEHQEPVHATENEDLSQANKEDNGGEFEETTANAGIAADDEVPTATQETVGDTVQQQPKRRRGPTKMKDIAKDPNTRIRVDFTDLGEPCGPGSVKLSSYIGSLVREHVPVIIEDWRKIGEERRTVLWKSVQVRFELDGEYEKAAVIKNMGCLWRSYKSRLVQKVIKAKNNADRMKLRPKNVPIGEWRKFVKLKTSPEFQVVSDQYKEKRRSQIPHTCSRKGMARLAEELKQESSEPSEVTRLKVWVKSRTKKDGTAVNTQAAETIRKANELAASGDPSSTSTNPKEDILSQVLGPDKPGRLRAMGRGMSMSKLACFQYKNKHVADMQKNQYQLQKQVQDLQEALAKLNHQRPTEPEIGENSTPISVKNRLKPKCVLHDWSGTDDIVAEGIVLSSDRGDFIDNTPLGPGAYKVLVETVLKSEAWLWRPALKMFTIGEAVGTVIAWSQNYTVVYDDVLPDDFDPKSPRPDSANKCKLLDWDKNDEEVVAEGRWISKDREALVNGLPIGPGAIKIFLDKVMEPETFLWRPTPDLSTIEDSLKSYVAWPVNRVMFFGVNMDTPAGSVSPLQQSTSTPAAPVKKTKDNSQSNSQTPTQKSQQSIPAEVIGKENQKCMLMDITGLKRVVAEGRWSSNDPNMKVHFKPLGPNGVRVWVDVVRVNDAEVWRPSDAVECMEDALGTTVAWPRDKVVLV